MLTHRGQVGADTKSYLYFDPERLLERAWSMWDANVGMGTVTHQNIGYLWPMGPWYRAFEAIGAPDWFAQRLWLATILFTAGLGVRFLMRSLGQDGPHVTAAMFVYALSPYVLTLGARISALLLPFAGLPWMIGLAVRATRDRDWFHPALFALLIPTIGSTNATALVLSGIGPVLWIAYAVLVLREATVRQGAAVVARIGVLSVATSLWWIAGLYCQGAFGIDVLRYTETARTVAQSSTAPEILRGIGYWFFYGDDKLGPWIEPSVLYTQSPLLIMASFLVAVIGLLAAGVIRWRYRGYFVGLIVVGTVVGVGAYPWDGAPPFGRAVRAFLLSDSGLAMRSLPRAVPLLTLGLAVLTGAALAALGGWARRSGRTLTIAVTALAVLSLPPLWLGDMVADNLDRPEEVPAYWLEAAAEIDARGRSVTGWETRVLEVPGSDFASYRWGNTVDPLTPGITDRPYVARELIPYGTPPSADLLNAFDRQMQEALLDPAAIAPVARFMGVGDIVLRGDLQYERYNLPRPRQLWHLLNLAPGLGAPTAFGTGFVNVPDPELPLEDELELAADPDLADPPAVALFPLDDGGAPIVRAMDASTPVLLAGNAEGLIDAAAAGLLTGDELVLYPASFADDPEGLAAALDRPGAALVVTDTNRRSARRWGTVHENNGLTERAGEEPMRSDPSDNRLPLFPDADDDSSTVAEHRGGVSARATAYGNPVTYTPEDRPANAVDDDLLTAWSVGAFSPVLGEKLEITYDEPQTTDTVRFVQSSQGVPNRWITRARITFDGDEHVDVDLPEGSRTAPGAGVAVGEHTFSTMTVEILQTDVGPRDVYDGLSSVGFADVRLGEDDPVRLDEVIVIPRDLLAAAGESSADMPLSVVLTRQRSRPTAALRTDPEIAIVRAVDLPTARSFSVTGTARLSTRAPEQVTDEILGVTGADGRPIAVATSRTIPGDLTARGVNAVDGDPTTHWSPGFLDQEGEYVRVTREQPVTFDRMDLRVVTDGRHSVPTRIRIEADGRPAAAFDLPPLPDLPGRDDGVTVPLEFDPITGAEITVVVERVREVRTNDWISKDPVVMPVGISELGIDALEATIPGGTLDTGCRDDLLTIDGRPVPMRVRGPVDDALAGDPLPATPCDGDVEVPEGQILIRTGVGRDMGIDVDRLLLEAAAPDGRTGTEPAAPVGTTVTAEGRTSFTVDVDAREEDAWLVLGQSHSLGWRATLDGVDLGEPTLVNGYANGWLLPPGAAGTVELRWAPQRIVNGALLLSAVAVLGCIVLAGLGLRRRRRGLTVAWSGPDDAPLPLSRRAGTTSPGARPGAVAAVALAVVSGVAGVLLIGPLAGLAVGALVAAAVALPRARAITSLGPAACLAASGIFTVASQVRSALPPGFPWPRYFEEVHPVAYAGILLLAADLVVDRLWTGRWTPEEPRTGPADG